MGRVWHDGIKRDEDNVIDQLGGGGGVGVGGGFFF